MIFLSLRKRWVGLFGGIVLVGAVFPLTAQNRDIRAERLVLDDNAEDGTMNMFTLEVPDLASNLTLTLPGSLPAADGFVLVSSMSGHLDWSDSLSLRGLRVSGGAVDFSGATSVTFGAGSISFDDIGSGTSTGSSLVVGAGSTLSAAGGGAITATEFAGTGSTSSAVDLGTGEVSGVLGIASGGTGGATASDARTNLGLGTLSTQDASSVNITGGTIDGVTLSGTLGGSPVYSGTPDYSNGLTVSGGAVDFSGATSVTFGAGSISFDDIGSGTSTGSSLVVGAGSTLSAAGGGAITATEFAGTGSTSSAVDLGTGEVSGVLSIANGGTNSTAAPTAGGIVYGDGTSYQFTTAGTAGQFLISDGTNAPVWTNSVPALGAPLSITGSPAAGAMLTINEDGANSPALLDLQVDGSSVVVVENSGETGFGVPSPEHPVHAVNSQTTDERAAVYGGATGSTGVQAVGVWGDANNTNAGNTGSIGVLATGNGNGTVGTTNVALQVSDGEFAMGRTTETGTGYTVVEGGTAGTAYSAQGASGVIEIAIPGIIIALPVVGQSLFNTTVTVNNRYVSSNSIVLVTIQDAPAGLISILGTRLVATAIVSGRASGSFDLTFAIQNLSLLPLNLGAGNVRIGYMVINPSR